MTALLPVSVAPKPPVVKPPKYLEGSMMSEVFPMREAWIAALTPADVPP